MAVGGIHHPSMNQTTPVRQHASVFSNKTQGGKSASGEGSSFEAGLLASLGSSEPAASTSMTTGYTRPVTQSPVSNDTINLLEQRDSDANGTLGVDELGLGEETFNTIDKNDDGAVDPFELQMARDEKVRSQAITMLNTSLMANHDSDGDDQLTAEELGLDEEAFGTIDSDSDGFASLTELNTSLTNRLSAYKALSAQTLSESSASAGVSISA